MKLFYLPGACSLGIHALLETLGVPFSLEKADLGSQAFAKVNPAKAVPALVLDSGQVLTQGPAIMQYLADRFPEQQLGKAASLEVQAGLQAWLAFASSDFHGAFKPLFGAQRFTLQTDDPSLAAVQEAAKAKVEQLLVQLETVLAGKDFLAEGRLTIADLYLFPMLRWAKAKVGLEQVPAVAAYLARMLALPAVQRAMASEGLQ
ncbi:glutathione binding-like protein [Gallaecimonas xiamenensis]|uniref:Glutathione S-transferase n=1 Tax=Gallaecimonas xiamenensis 3-C-1 TaxID=745411 RepID=K2J831_9GAMM|nr:glutathione binding-like protein [Gallaecimonas xiamenensis]EKE71022.1 glutathione S-transferase [Gallaecimonas xiamenensis 3-C-1]